MLPQESIGEGLQNFFVKALHWNGNARRRGVRSHEIREASDLIGDCGIYLPNLAYGQQYRDESYMQLNPPLLPLQFDDNVVSQANMEGCVPEAVQLTAALGDDEILSLQASDT